MNKCQAAYRVNSMVSDYNISRPKKCKGTGTFPGTGVSVVEFEDNDMTSLLVW
jgi:hypothetical protein